MNRRSVAVAATAGTAGLGRRAAAVGLDVVLAVLVGGWLGVVLAVDAVTSRSGDANAAPAVASWLGLLCGGLSLALAVVQWALHGRLGWTVGRLLLGLRTVDARTRRPIGMGRVLLRGLVVAAGSLALGVGQLVVLLSPLFDPSGRRQGWHDRAARAVVLDTRKTATVVAPPPPPRPDVVRAASTTSFRAPSSEPGPGFPPPPPPRVPAVAAVPAGPNATPGAAPAAPGPVPAPVTGPITRPLVLAPLAPHRAGPDLDTRALPLVPPPPPSAAPGRPSTAAPAAPLVDASAVPSPGRDVLGHPVPHTSGADEDVETTRRALPPVPPPSPTPSRITTAVLEISDGQRVEVRRTALVGRNPAAATDGVQLVRVVDPGRSVSKTHLQLAVEPSGVWVADRGSTNGTVVTLPDGGQVICPVDQPVRLRLGSVVVFGDCSMRLVDLS